MKKKLISELVLIFILTSMVVNYPNVSHEFMFYIRTLSIFIIGFLFFLCVSTYKNLIFFLSKSGIYLLTCFFCIMFYHVVTLTTPGLLFFSIIFIVFFSYFGSYIGWHEIKLRFLSTLVLIIINLMLLRVCLASFFDSYQHVYDISDYNLEIGSVGYNLGRTGWAISLLFFISFIKLFKSQLAGLSYFKNLMLLISIVLSCLCIFMSDSRTGIIFLITLLIFWNFRYLKLKLNSIILPLTIIFIEIFLASSLFLVSLLNNTRMSTFLTGDDISNGRFEGLLVGLNIIKDNFIIGTYPVQVYDLKDYGFQYSEIHNVWLNLMAIYGVPLIVLLMTFIVLFIVGSIRIEKYNREHIDYGTFILLVAIGFIVTFLEPNAIISFLSYSSIYWFVLGLSFSLRKKVKWL